MSTAAAKLTISAGAHSRNDCPVVFRSESLAAMWEASSSHESPAAPIESDPGSSVRTLVDDESGERIAIQKVEDDKFAIVVDALRAGATRSYILNLTDSSRELTYNGGVMRNVATKQSVGNALDIEVNGRLLTRYHFGASLARPYFHPLLNSEGISLTRGYPMLPDVPGERHDHKHHRSLWIAHGDVNGADNWSEETGHGYTVHEAVEALFDGPIVGGFRTTSQWIGAARNPLLTQELDVKAWAVSDSLRILDFSIDLTASHGDVVFGDTKEGGILSVRVASEIDGDRGGKIENSYGGIGESETWGKSAHWCDYSGILSGSQVGIAVMDHPLSFRYPTHWHVRDYGLMTANPFGYSAFTEGAKNGSFVLPGGERMIFRYRMILHSGQSDTDVVRAQYLNWVAPPTAQESPFMANSGPK